MDTQDEKYQKTNLEAKRPAPDYPVGSEVYLKANFNDEPDYIGVVMEVTDCQAHYYYNVAYTDASGRNMMCGCADKHIRGLVPRREIDITPKAELLSGEDNVYLLPVKG